MNITNKFIQYRWSETWWTGIASSTTNKSNNNFSAHNRFWYVVQSGNDDWHFLPLCDFFLSVQIIFFLHSVILVSIKKEWAIHYHHHHHWTLNHLFICSFVLFFFFARCVPFVKWLMWHLHTQNNNTTLCSYVINQYLLLCNGKSSTNNNNWKYHNSTLQISYPPSTFEAYQFMTECRM